MTARGRQILEEFMSYLRQEMARMDDDDLRKLRRWYSDNKHTLPGGSPWILGFVLSSMAREILNERKDAP